MKSSRAVLKETITTAVNNILDAAEPAQSVEITVNVDKESLPTISYKINGFPIINTEGII